MLQLFGFVGFAFVFKFEIIVVYKIIGAESVVVKNFVVMAYVGSVVCGVPQCEVIVNALQVIVAVVAVNDLVFSRLQTVFCIAAQQVFLARAAYLFVDIVHIDRMYVACCGVIQFASFA